MSNRTGERALIAAREFTPDDTEPMIGAAAATYGFLENANALREFGVEPVIVLDERDKPRHLSLRGPSSNNTYKYLQDTNSSDLLALHLPGTPDLLDGLRFRARIPGAPLPVTGTTHSVSYSDYILKGLLQSYIGGLTERDTIICTSRAARSALLNYIDYVREKLKGIGIKQFIEMQLPIIPLGVDTERFRPRDSSECRRDLALPMDSNIVLWMGRFSMADKADMRPMLIAAARLLFVHKDKPITFVFAGEDRNDSTNRLIMPFAQSLGIASNIRFYRNPGRITVSLLYGATDIVWSPVDSIQESFGLSVTQGMAAGCACLVSHCDGYRDLIQHNQTGRLIRTIGGSGMGVSKDLSSFSSVMLSHFLHSQTTAVDLDDLIINMSDLLVSKELRQSLGERARKDAVERFSWMTVMGRYVELWRDLLERSPRSNDRQKNFFDVNLSEIFSDFASSHLKPDNIVRLTDEGAACLIAEEKLDMYEQISFYFDSELLSQIIMKLAETPNGLAVKDLCKILSKSNTSMDDFIIDHIAWLIKYGICSLKQANSSLFHIQLQSGQ